MSDELSTRLWPLERSQELSWHLTSVPQLGATQHKFQFNGFLNVVFGPAALELLERACYPVPTPRLLNRNLFGVWNLTKVESILNLIVTNNGLVVLVYGTGELWNVPEKQKLRCVREVRGGGGAVRRIPSMTKMVTVSHLSPLPTSHYGLDTLSARQFPPFDRCLGYKTPPFLHDPGYYARP